MNKQQTLDLLDQLKISYRIVEHPPANTIEEIDSFHLPDAYAIAKNLFLRDEKKRHYYLIVMRKDKTANLKKICLSLGSRPLSFASEENLLDYLGLRKGAVTPLGILNDENKKVEVIFDKDLLLFRSVGIHPMENTATVWLSLVDLVGIIKMHGNTVSYLELK